MQAQPIPIAPPIAPPMAPPMAVVKNKNGKIEAQPLAQQSGQPAKTGFISMLVPTELKTTVQHLSGCKERGETYSLPAEIKCEPKAIYDGTKPTFKISASVKGMQSDPVIDPLKNAIEKYNQEHDDKIKVKIINTCLKLATRDYLTPLQLLLYYYASKNDADSIIYLDMTRVLDEYIKIPQNRKATVTDYKGGVPDEYINNIIEAFNNIYRQEKKSMESKQMTSPPEINNTNMGGSYRKRKHNKTQRKRKRDKRKRKTQRKR